MSEGPTTTSSPAQGVANATPASSGAAASHEAAGGGAASSQPVQELPQVPSDAKAEEPEWKTAEDLEACWETRQTFFTEKQRADTWKEMAEIVEKYSDALIERWNKEIDNLLIYAGLFSAIQTAFNIELYKRLIPDPAPVPDPVLVALERISAQLSGFTVSQAFVNSTQSPFVILQSTPSTPAVPVWVVVLNALWFSSLISSLSAASIGIMVKQWLTEYKSGVSGTSRQIARLHQLRLNSLQRWRVKEIVSILPVLLQIASVLFFAGLLILLWNLNRTVAIIGTVLVGFLAAFSLSTIILPSIATHCSYLSPPSRALFELVRLAYKALYLLRLNLCTWILSLYSETHCLQGFQCSIDPSHFQSRHPRIYSLCKILFPLKTASTLAWSGMESTLVSRRAKTLDGEMVATAYTTSMNTNFLQHAAMCTTELTPGAMRTCFQRIMSANIAQWGRDGHRRPMWSVHPCMWSGALIALMDASSDDAVWSPSTLVAALKTAYSYITPWIRQLQSDTPGAGLLCVDLAHIIRHYDPSTLPPNALHPQRIYRYFLLLLKDNTRDINLGNDIRKQGNFPYSSRFVDRLRAYARILAISTYIDDVLKGLEVSIIEDVSIERALKALLLIIYCVPSRTGSDYKCDDPEYKAIQSQAARALNAFSNFLSMSLPSAEEYALDIDTVFDALREHGERAGLMSTELRGAIVRYRDAYQSAHETLPWYWERSNKEWVQKLRRELDNPAQNTTVGVASTSGGTADPPIVAAPAAVSHDSVSVAVASQQISGTRDDIQTDTLPVNGSSTPSTSPPSTAQIAPAVVPNELVASARGEADAHPPTKLDVNGRSPSAAPLPSICTAAVDAFADSHPSAVKDDLGTQLAATESSIEAPPFPDYTATVNEPTVSVPGTAQGDRGAHSQEELATNVPSSAPSTPPPSSGGSGLP